MGQKLNHFRTYYEVLFQDILAMPQRQSQQKSKKTQKNSLKGGQNTVGSIVNFNFSSDIIFSR